MTGSLTPERLIVNGRALEPPDPEAEPVILTVTFTPTSSLGAIIPWPPFAFREPRNGVTHILYASYGAEGRAWISLAPSYQGTPPRWCCPKGR